ncbi:MAG: response regulator [Rubrobacter sp.]|nr:response regulator [Rubrobacter sp.]
MTKKETPEVAERTKETASIRRASEASHKTRVLVADEHTMFSEVLGGAMVSYDDEVEIVGLVNDEGAALAAQRKHPDVVITEVAVPAEWAKEAVRRLLAVRPRPKVLVLTKHKDPGLAHAVLEAGGAPVCTRAPLFRSCWRRYGARPNRQAEDPMRNDRQPPSLSSRGVTWRARGGTPRTARSQSGSSVLCSSWVRVSPTARSPLACTSVNSPSNATWPTCTQDWG